LGRADLHTHTSASDGELTAKELLDKAKSKGLSTLSITDHDTIDGYIDALDKSEKMGIELIPGVELSTIWKNREVHLLAYGFDPESASLRNLLLRQKRARKLRMREIVHVLNKKGLEVDYDEIMAYARGANIGRPHAAAVLIKKGYAANVADAFIRYLSLDEILKIKTEYTDIESAVRIVKESGGVLSVAHPGPLYSTDELKEMILAGIDGIECIHPSHNFNVQKVFTEMAKSMNLLITGGSDFHGSPKSDYDPYLGVVTLGTHHVEALKRTCNNRKALLKD
jgi:predicted metal-dependent phosphoesterase TrpH